MEERTFQDWLEGKFGLNSSDILFEYNDGVIPADMPEAEKIKLKAKKFEWMKNNEQQYLIKENELPAQVLSCIKKEQQKIFKNILQDKLEHLKKDFNNSRKSKKYKDDEIHDIKVILDIRTSEKSLQEDIKNNYLFNRNIKEVIEDLDQIRSYYLKEIKPNRPKSFGFINSPKFKFQEIGKVPYQIMATALYQYLKWLENDNRKVVNENKFNNPPIAIAIFFEGLKLKEVANEWISEYGKSTNSLSILNDAIKNLRTIINPPVAKRKQMYRNICEAKKILEMRKSDKAISQINDILNKHYHDFIN
jgi:hypothetical protein